MGLEVSAADGALEMRWLDIARGAWQAPQIAAGGDSIELNAPGKGHWTP